ncbi:alpha/beta fold hydrolase [Nocardia alni]|uniref:alpha/beta fold hydrolase n=1 Tax=Nocardia alni TaxID=2815723 RepID=UPI001C241AD1|nr:alpha/beta hydrolase [Nocardia alni]
MTVYAPGSDESEVGPTDAAGHGRTRRWLWRVVAAIAAVIVAGTVFSFGYNVATRHRASPPVGLTYVRTGDISTRYRQWGESGTPIVLVHGFIESADTWQYLAPRLAAAGHRVYALDLDGFGYTQRGAPFDLDHQTSQLLEFIQALRLERPIVVGHSSGAAIVAAATLRNPEAVGGLMFLDGDGLSSGAGARSPVTKLLIDPYRTTLLRLAVRSDTLVQTAYRSACGPSCPKLDASGIDQWRRPLQVPGAEPALWAMMNLGVPGLSSDRIAELARIPLPKSVVFGAADSVFSSDTPIRTAERIGAGAPTMIPGARHLTPVNSPGAVASAILALAQSR